MCCPARVLIFILTFITLTGCCRLSPTKCKEARLRQDLKILRDQIANYTVDHERAPQSLQTLVDAGYLRKIPRDPFTDSAETWQVENSDTLISLDQTEPGISNVHSGSNLVGSDGTRYSTW
jgi:general secretion pathway protein G